MRKYLLDLYWRVTESLSKSLSDVFEIWSTNSVNSVNIVDKIVVKGVVSIDEKIVFKFVVKIVVIIFVNIFVKIVVIASSSTSFVSIFDTFLVEEYRWESIFKSCKSICYCLISVILIAALQYDSFRKVIQLIHSFVNYLYKTIFMLF